MKPQVINVFGKTYRIEYKPLEDIDGECHNKKALIEIDESLQGRDLAQTILHESFHALFHRLSLSQVVHHDVEEIICDTFATFIVDNGLAKIPE